MSDKTKPYETGTWYDLGVALLAEERSKEALAAFTEASAIDPHYPLLQNKIVTALIGLGHYIKALQIGENLVRDRPKDATAWATLALSASCCRKWDRSLTAAQRAFKLKYLSSELEVVTGVCLEEPPGRPSDRMVLKISNRFLWFLVASYAAANASATGTQ